jgi:hypothetical protein
VFRRTLLAVPTVATVALLSGCGGSTNGSSTSTTGKSARPTQIIAGPAGLLAGTAPQLGGSIWLLSGSPTAKTLHQLTLPGGTLSKALPASTGAVAIEQSTSGLLALAVATQTTGAVDFLNGSTAAPVSSVAVGAPVIALTAGADGATFYALDGTSTSMSVTVIDSLSNKTVSTIPVPLDTVSIAVDPTQQRLFALERNGQMEIVAIAGNQVLSRFSVGQTPLRVILSGDGQSMYVLKSVGDVDNIGVFNVATEHQLRVVAAPAHTVDLQVSSDASSAYAFVGTAALGNIQVLRLSPAG